MRMFQSETRRFGGPLTIALVSFAVACLVMGITSFQYYTQLQSTIRTETSGYLQEITRRIASNVDRIVEDNQANLYTVATILSSSDIDSFTGTSFVVGNQKQYWNFEDILFINESGKAYSSSGTPVVLNNDHFFTAAIVEHRASISNTQMINGAERILMSVPLEGVTVGGERMMAVAAVFDPASFERALSMDAFNSMASSAIIDANGTVVVRPSDSASIDTGYNILTTISNASMDEDSCIDRVKASMSNGVPDQMSFTLNGLRYYALYTPISFENWHMLTFVPADIVNARSDAMLQTTLVLCGLITLVSAVLIALILFISSRNKRRLENLAYVDAVTKGHTTEKFAELARSSLDNEDGPVYALMFSNIEKFKVLNERYGESECDDMLRMFHHAIEKNLRKGEAIGRIAADNFSILLEYETDEVLAERLLTCFADAEVYAAENHPIWTLPAVDFGVFVIDDRTLPLPKMIDRAKIALKGYRKNINNKIRIAYYDDVFRQKLLRDKELEERMENALSSGEFKVYLQPKYHLPDKKIIGAEALSRWQEPDGSMIYPDEFIPLFERNGFIVQLDLWVFEEVCRLLRTWLNEGNEPIKVSVNCSRVHLRNLKFLDRYCEIASRHDVPRKLLEIELTESIAMEDADYFSSVVVAIREAGFSCSIDDFGSGYSSLNMIRNLSVDTMKLDKMFFREDDGDPQRMAAVVKGIIDMAKALQMCIVAEGVEKENQVCLLEELGCDCIQGYVFARPMPVSDFEKLAFGNEGGDRA